MRRTLAIKETSLATLRGDLIAMIEQKPTAAKEPVVEQGLQCVKCGRIYPIVSDIPVMLVDEAFENE